MILFSLLSLLSLMNHELPYTVALQPSTNAETTTALYLTFSLDRSSYAPGQTVRMIGYVSTKWTFPILTTMVQDGLTTTRTVTSDFLLQPELHIVILNPSSQYVYQRNDTVVGDINQAVVYFTEDYELASTATLGTYVAKISSVQNPFVVYQVRTIRTVVTQPETTVTTQYVTTEVDEFPNKALLIILALAIGWPVLARGFKKTV